MKGDIAGGPLPGVTPILLAGLALMDATVESVQPLDAAGRSGVDIRFRLPGAGSKRATYVSGDLSIGGGPPLPFGSGYHIRPDEANLLIAVKR